MDIKVIGRNTFHVRYIRLSYRIRGSVHRIQMNREDNHMVFSIRRKSIISVEVYPENNTTEIRLINRIFVYSAIKIRANILALYSVLNPDTSSDSPSARSKGVRFVSARLVVNQIIARGMEHSSIHDIVDDEIIDISMI